MKITKLITIAAIALLTAACSKVPAGNVGVKVYLLGGDKGVDSEVVGPGRYWVGLNEDLFLFPTFTQNFVWTQDSQAGSETDESISFQTVEGMSVNADIGISYAIDPAKVSEVFQKYRKGVGEITDMYLRNMVRDALVKAASDQPIETVYGRGKTELIAEVEEEVRRQVSPIGINVERVYWIGDIRLPQAVINSINAKIQATQIAQQRENEVAAARAEADKAVAQARGESESRLMMAKAEAEAIRIKAEALRENPKLVELNAVEKWDGKLPVNMYGSSPLPFLSVQK